METSESFTQSTMVLRCRCTACVSTLTTFASMFSATYRMLLSRLERKRPRMLMASTRRPPMLSTPMMVCTHSYRIEFPAFLLPSTFVATCARMSAIWSDVALQPAPSTRSRRSVFTCRKGSVVPLTSWSGVNPLSTRLFSIRTRSGTTCGMARSWAATSASTSHMDSMSCMALTRTPWCRSFSSRTAPSTKFSSRSGTFFTMRIAQRLAFLRMYALWLPRSFSTSGARSRDISAEATLPTEQSASPTMN
mmetsp:Transcript_4732/g.9633  ORF Transcript_4732/g.9633 Transcript_4732/m.9633 type:complete len:249 (-) Transcript_4732:520-1266(-)